MVDSYESGLVEERVEWQPSINRAWSFGTKDCDESGQEEYVDRESGPGDCKMDDSP